MTTTTHRISLDRSSPGRRRGLRLAGACAAFLSFLHLFAAAQSPSPSAESPLAVLWRERVRCVVAVEFQTETEIDRRSTIVSGLVLDADGVIAIPGEAASNLTPPSRLVDFRVYRPGQKTSGYSPAEYIGPDGLTGWRYIRVAPGALRDALVPVTVFVKPGAPEPGIGATVWGIGLRNKDEDFAPYFLESKVSSLMTLPRRSLLALDEIAGPNLPVFTADGALAGVGQGGFGESFLMYSRAERGQSVFLVNTDETPVARLASEILPWISRVPQNVFGRPSAWLGLSAVEPVDSELAALLKLDDQSALVVSGVLEGSPAEKGGVQARDIIVGIDGAPLPRLKPDRVVPAWMELQLARRAPGDVMRLSVLRNSGERVELPVTLGDEPRNTAEAERKYFDAPGFAVREFVYSDAVARRVKQSESAGVVASFVKHDSPASIAGLRMEDWIRQIDGAAIATYADAIRKLDEIAADTARTEFVLQTSRNGETAVLRVKLK